MSSRLNRCLKSLESASFIRCTDYTSIPSIRLLNHGSAYAKQVQQHWLSMRQLAVNFGRVTSTESISQQRFAFVHSKQFQKHFQQLRQSHPSKAKCPTLVKHQRSVTFKSGSNSIFDHEQPVTQLVTDFYVEPHRGLEHFYNVQRESKIWWMRYSSNPSRYAIVPYDFQSELDLREDCQAIDIKAAFGNEEEVTVEQLSLVTLPADKDFELPDARTGKLLLPKVIRSVIELEPATCGMLTLLNLYTFLSFIFLHYLVLLLDGCDNERGSRSLLLNRVLAPYQCSIAAIQKTEQVSPDLCDLCAHLADVLQSTRLRLHFPRVMATLWREIRNSWLNTLSNSTAWAFPILCCWMRNKRLAMD